MPLAFFNSAFCRALLNLTTLQRVPIRVDFGVCAMLSKFPRFRPIMTTITHQTPLAIFVMHPVPVKLVAEERKIPCPQRFAILDLADGLVVEPTFVNPKSVVVDRYAVLGMSHPSRSLVLNGNLT